MGYTSNLTLTSLTFVQLPFAGSGCPQDQNPTYREVWEPSLQRKEPSVKDFEWEEEDEIDESIIKGLYKRPIQYSEGEVVGLGKIF